MATNKPADAPELISIDEFVASSRPLYENYLSGLVGIPTVSADPEHQADITRGSILAASYLTESGFTTRIVPTAGHPVVIGHYVSDPSLPTVLVYNHLDVQPAPADHWQSPPFRLEIQGDKYIGRGATDDKGPAVSALFALRYAIAHQVPLNFTVVWEFEEEIGSPHFEEFLKAQNLKGVDSILVSDTIWLSRQKPAIPYGLRGNLTFEVSLKTARKDAHSGLAGGLARNPLGELAQIISECYDATSGKVHVPGFYDQVKPVSKHEQAVLAAAGFDKTQFMHDHELTSVRDGSNAQVMSAITTEPTFEVHGFVGGYTGPGVKTVIPPQATAKLSTRLVPNQNPSEVFALIKRFITAKHPDAKVTLDAMLEPYLEDPAGPYSAAAAAAVSYGFGLEPVFTREGGSIGALSSFKRHLNVPIVLLGLSLPDHGYHAPNEHFEWRQAGGGIKQFARYFTDIARIGAKR